MGDTKVVELGFKCPYDRIHILMSENLAYDRGVRLVKTELNRLVKLEVLTLSENTLPEGSMRGYRYEVDIDLWKVQLKMLYGESPIRLKNCI